MAGVTATDPTTKKNPWDWSIPDTTKATGTKKNADGSITNAAGGAMGKDQFVQLLVAEMKNQDPMNAMDGKELAAQLAQFSSVEQLMNIDTKLDTLTAAVKASNATSSSSSSSGSNSTSSTSGA